MWNSSTASYIQKGRQPYTTEWPPAPLKINSNNASYNEKKPHRQL